MTHYEQEDDVNPTIEEWDRQARQSQSLAEASRRNAVRRRREQRFFYLMAALIVAVVVALTWVGKVHAHHGAQCHSRSCEARVFNKNSPWRSSVASVYDGVGLGGRVACLGYWPGGYVVAHKTMACGTKVKFRYRGRMATARVWDRGPFVAGREWDLDVALQRRLGFPYGVAPVAWKVVR